MDIKNISKSAIGVRSSVMFCSKVRDLGFCDQALMIDKDYKKARVMMNHIDLTKSIGTVYLEMTAPTPGDEQSDVVDDFRVYITKIKNNKEEILFDKKYNNKTLRNFFDDEVACNIIASSVFD